MRYPRVPSRRGKTGDTVLAQAITGGLGTSQLAAEYAYRHRAEYDVVWWVRAEKRATLMQDLGALAAALGLNPGTRW